MGTRTSGVVRGSPGRQHPHLGKGLRSCGLRETPTVSSRKMAGKGVGWMDPSRQRGSGSLWGITRSRTVGRRIHQGLRQSSCAAGSVERLSSGRCLHENDSTMETRKAAATARLRLRQSHATASALVQAPHPRGDRLDRSADSGPVAARALSRGLPGGRGHASGAVHDRSADTPVRDRRPVAARSPPGDRRRCARASKASTRKPTPPCSA